MKRKKASTVEKSHRGNYLHQPENAKDVSRDTIKHEEKEKARKVSTVTYQPRRVVGERRNTTPLFGGQRVG